VTKVAGFAERPVPDVRIFATSCSSIFLVVTTVQVMMPGGALAQNSGRAGHLHPSWFELYDEVQVGQGS
jgi:hypothetical protein